MNKKTFWKWVADDLELLARLHAWEFNETTLDQLIKGNFPQSLVITTEKEKNFFALMRHALEDARSLPLDELAADFAAIYLNGTYKASPNESPWIDDDRLERQTPMFEVRKWYDRYNLTADNWRNRPDDNISLQMIFVAKLLRLPQIPFQDIATFLDQHLLLWVQKFGDTVLHKAETSFYAALAPLSAQYLESLRELIAIDQGILIVKQSVKKPQIQDPIEFDPNYYSGPSF